MAECKICGRPATTKVTLRQGGRTEQIALCDEHYAEAMEQRGFSASPLESLFSGSLFNRFFGDSWPSMFDQPGSTVRRLPQRRGDRLSVVGRRSDHLPRVQGNPRPP